jgi:hypothetical protein
VGFAVAFLSFGWPPGLLVLSPYQSLHAVH